jgi:extracellular elastinolytic metalloproteinase
MRYLIVVGGLLALLTWTLVSHNQTANAASIQPTTLESTVSNSRTAVSAEAGEQIARDYLLANAATLGLSRADLADLTVDLNEADGASGSRYVKFEQTVGGIKIYNAMLNVTILADGSVLYVGNRGIPNIAQAINTRTPSISHAEAIAAAANALQLNYTASTVVAEQTFGTVDQKVQFSGGDLSYESITVGLLYQPLADGRLRLVWNLDIYQRDGLHWWDVRVDAVTGELLDKADRAVSESWDALYNDPNQVPTTTSPVHLSGTAVTTFGADIVAPYAPGAVGSYRVFAMPLESPSHGDRTLVANPDNATASPFGWHDTNGVAGAEFTTTQGNNTHAYTDIDANNSPDAGSSPDGGAGLVFDSPLDLTLPPSGYRPAAVTNLFYWTNVLHDVSYVHGFSEPFRNFQENNYGNGGLGSDYINAEAQDGSETNNARYFHAAEGSNPRFQMYVWTAPNPDRDGDLDNGIILHEYGHGISLRLTGNGVSCLGNAEQMGEGWSDFQSVMLTQRPGDTATTRRGVGTYALNQPTTGTGIRPAPYTTDMTVNTYTYSNLPSLAIPHGVGFLWNTMLWDLN